MPKYIIVVAVAAVVFACRSSPEHPFPDESAVVGRVVDVDGSPAPSVFVTSRPADSMFSVSVTTNEDGEFATPLLGSDSYALAVHGVGIQEAVVEGSGNDAGLINVARDDADLRASSSRFLALLPDGETKRRFILDCTGCHQFDRQMVEVESRRRSRESWIERITQMLSFSGASTQFPIISPSRDPHETADWLVAHLGTTESGAKPAKLTHGSNVTPGMATVTEYPLPEPADLPHDLAVDSRGHVIVTGMFSHLLYDLDPETGRFETNPIPVEFANPRAVEIDEAGVIWSLLGFPRRIARYDPASEAWSSFEIGVYPHSIVPDGKGKVWFNGHFTKNPELIGSLDTATGDVDRYEVPVPAMPDSGSNIPYGLRMGRDGTLWGTELVGNRLIKFDDGKFSVYPLPTPFSGPRRPDVAPDGRVWIPEYANNRLAVFDPDLETFTEYELPTRDALPYVVRYHPETGHVWVATAAADAVFRFDPAERHFVTYPLPTPRSLIRHMAVDPSSNGVWVAYGNSPSVTPKVARIAPW